MTSHLNWRYNESVCQWELGWELRDTTGDPAIAPPDRFIVHAFVADELIDRAANMLPAVAAELKHKIGSVPPPLQQYITGRTLLCP